MFIQVIRGMTSDSAALRARAESWQSEIGPGAAGYLGTTMGILDDGAFIICARFESEESAMANSDRPQQGEWFAETAKLFDGEPTFLNVTDVQPWLDGGSDAAGFVQVMIGHSPDRDALRAAATSDADMLRAARPEIIGGMQGVFGSDGFVNVGYFTSEAEARTGESQEPPPQAQEFQRLMGEVEFIDIHDPILQSP